MKVGVLSVVVAVLITGCTPLIDTSPAPKPSQSSQSEPSESELTRGEKIAQAYEEARQAAENQPDETPSEDTPHEATAKHPNCDSVAWIRYGSQSDANPGSATLVGEPVDTGPTDGATGTVVGDAAGVPEVYTVEEGDTLDNIAARLCIENWDLASLNDLTRETAVLTIGETLVLQPAANG
ncbi:hypothetical protein GCM10027071_00040 [Microbacterium marinum]